MPRFGTAFWYICTLESRAARAPRPRAAAPAASARPARARPPPAPRAAAAAPGAPRPGPGRAPAAPQRCSHASGNKRVARRETSRSINVRLAVIHKRVNQLICQHLNEHVQLGGRPADGLFGVDSSSRAPAASAPTQPPGGDACWSRLLYPAKAFSSNNWCVPTEHAVSAVLLVKVDDKRARTCGRRRLHRGCRARCPACLGRASASCVAVCMPRLARAAWRSTCAFFVREPCCSTFTAIIVVLDLVRPRGALMRFVRCFSPPPRRDGAVQAERRRAGHPLGAAVDVSNRASPWRDGVSNELRTTRAPLAP